MAAPTVGIAVTDSALAAGETSLVTFTFSEAVLGFDNGDIAVANGSLSAVSSGDGGVTWTATLTPSANVTDATNVITVDNTGVTDGVGTPGVGTTDSNNYAIDTDRPTATVAVADNSLTVGETSGVTITFSEAVTGFTASDLTVANGAVSGLSSGDGGVTWTATVTPSANTTDATNVITLDNTGIVDAAGNTGTGTTDSNNYAIDTDRPTATIVVADSSLTAGETAAITITFSEAVTGFDNSDLTVANGSLSAVSSGDGGVTWTATFTPTASITDATNVITLDNTSVADAVGNAGTGTTDSNTYAVDTTVAPPAPPPPPVVIAGSVGSNEIEGNSLDNIIAAGGGADTVFGADGGDEVGGGDGADVLQGNAGADSLTGDAGDDVVLGGRDDDFVQGNAGNDYVSGDRGNDTVRGGQGDDVVGGGVGDDFVSGDRGSDTMTGGDGADIFHSFGEAGLDIVTDFNFAEGDRVQLDAGTTYEAAQVGDDTVLTLSGGGELVLQGVDLASLGDGWIA